MELHGTPYERGYQHGQHFANKIRSFYTMMLTNSLLPYLNREQPDIAEFLLTYQEDRYQDGQFSYRMLLESGQAIEPFIPQEYIDEMHGVADGAGLEYDDILLINTLFDSMVAFRAMVFFIRAIQAPQVLSVDFGDLSTDGIDNDGDGVVDQPGEGFLEPYDPTRYASMVEVPPDATITIRLQDTEGVNPELVRFQLNLDVYHDADEEVTTTVTGDPTDMMDVAFHMESGFEPAAEYTINIAAGDNTWVTDPPPAHARMMRDMRITFTTAGDGRERFEVRNLGYDDGRFQPPSSSFAVRDTATADGEVRLAHHFSLLDANTSHKHTVVFVHHTDEGFSHATVGWTGLIFGFSGMNSEGLAFSVNMSDTLNNPIAREFMSLLFYAQIKTEGIPVGIMGREMLKNAATVEEAVEWLRDKPPTYGWNFLFADRNRSLTAVEMHANVLDDATNIGFYSYTPDTSDASNYDEHGQMLASVGPDDLRTASHYQHYYNDIDYQLLTFHIQSQRFWTSFFFKSLRTFYLMGDAIEQRYGQIDTAAMQEIIGLDELVDQRDSMNATVYEPERGLLHFAMGQVPATSGPWVTVDIGAMFDGSAQ
ncbi:MAG: carcinine hydrolase/isopenicillin-N N-acyltransferase family protein [bacterium]